MTATMSADFLPGNRPLKVDLTKSITTWPLDVKLRRAAWVYLVRPVFLLLPRPFNRLRVQLLRLMGAQIGPQCLIEPGVDVLMPWNLIFAPNVAVGRGVNFYNYAPIRVGQQTLISQDAHLCAGSHDYTHPNMPLIYAPITIGTECWIAAEAFVAPGVTIGNGCVIGARAVVTKDMPEWTVCAGNPCRPIKARVIHAPAPGAAAKSEHVPAAARPAPATAGSASGKP
jgi:putative colanic acid biosynthesis acetyltransferase WcaF